MAAALSHWVDERPLAAAAAQGQLREALRRRQTLGLRGVAVGGTHAEGVALRLGRLSAARQASPPGAAAESQDPYAGAPTLHELLGGQGADAEQAPVAQDRSADPYAEAQTLANLLCGTESHGGQEIGSSASAPPMHDASATGSGVSRSDLALLRSMVSSNQPGHLPFTDQEKNSTGWALRGCGILGSQQDHSKGAKYYYPQGSLSDSAQQRQEGSVRQKDRRDRFRLEFQKGLLHWQGAKAHTLNANVPPMFGRRAEFLRDQYHQLTGTKTDPNAQGVTPEEVEGINRLFPGQVDDMLAAATTGQRRATCGKPSRSFKARGSMSPVPRSSCLTSLAKFPPASS
ncbi:MAG TPA: hypothetical protein PLW65_08780 [Pseudomonadota bacterium]|nr:hypothetical protein [Pseudomonadota bacterium]